MKKLVDKIGEGVKGQIVEAKLSNQENEIRKYILRKFAENGRPPATGEVKQELGLSSIDIVDQTIEKLQR